MALSRLQNEVDMLAHNLTAAAADIIAVRRRTDEHFKYATWVIEGTESIEGLYHEHVEGGKGKGGGWPAVKDGLVWGLLEEMAEHLGLSWPLQSTNKAKNGEKDAALKLALSELYEALWRGPGGRAAWAEVTDVSEGDGEGDEKNKATVSEAEKKEEVEERCCAAEERPVDKDKRSKEGGQSKVGAGAAEKGQGLAGEDKKQAEANSGEMEEDGKEKKKDEAMGEWKRTWPQHIIQNVYPQKHRPDKTPGSIAVRKPFVFTVQLEPGLRALQAARIMSDVLIGSRDE